MMTLAAGWDSPVSYATPSDSRSTSGIDSQRAGPELNPPFWEEPERIRQQPSGTVSCESKHPSCSLPGDTVTPLELLMQM